MTLNSHIEALEARHEIELKISGDSGAFMVRKLDPFFSLRSEAKEGDKAMRFISSGSATLITG